MVSPSLTEEDDLKPTNYGKTTRKFDSNHDCDRKRKQAFLFINYIVRCSIRTQLGRGSSRPEVQSIRRQVNVTCLSRVSTYDSRPLVSDASSRWRLNLFRFCLYTEQVCCGSPSWHSGSSSAFPFFIQVHTLTVTLARPLFAMSSETHLISH